MMFVYDTDSLNLVYISENENTLTEEMIDSFKKMHGSDKEFACILKDNDEFDIDSTYEIINVDGVVNVKFNKSNEIRKEPTEMDYLLDLDYRLSMIELGL